MTNRKDAQTRLQAETEQARRKIEREARESGEAQIVLKARKASKHNRRVIRQRPRVNNR